MRTGVKKMKTIFISIFITGIFICVFLSTAFSAQPLKVALIETDQPGTPSGRLSGILQAINVAYTDITSSVKSGTLDIDSFDILMIGSFAVSDDAIKETLDKNKKALREFVTAPKTLIVFSQTAEAESYIPWLPDSVYVSRCEEDYDTIQLVQPAHLILTTPNKILPADFNQLKDLEFPLVYNSILECTGCEVIASRDIDNGFPSVVVAGQGKGRIIFIEIPLDKIFSSGDADAQSLATHFMQNVINYAQMVKDEKISILNPQKVSPPRHYAYPIAGTVYLDENGKGKRDAGESPIVNIAVSDGLSTVFTDKNGEYRLPNATRTARFVYVVLSSAYDKSSQWYHVLMDRKKDERFDFFVKPAEQKNDRAFSFVQVTDTHVDSEEDSTYLKRELEVIGSVVNKPEFLVVTGDFVNHARHISQLKHYLRGAEDAPGPLYNVIGNHDLCSGSDPIFNYIDYLGPDHYSFDHGAWHFIVYNIIKPTDEQTRWLREDIKVLGANKKIVLFQHYPPGAEQIAELESLGVDYVFTGHWHSTRIQDYGTLRHYNTPPLFLGGIDISPSGFMEIRVEDDTLSTRYNYRVDKSFVTISFPRKDMFLYPHTFDIVVDTYDRAGPIRQVTYELIDEKGKKVQSGELKKAGIFTWRKPDDDTSLPVGIYTLRVTAALSDGNRLVAESEFDVIPIKRLMARPRLGNVSPMFMGTPEHAGINDERLRPPFVHQWSYSTGGWLDLASPVVADGTLFITTKRHDSSGAPEIVALNIKTGELAWKRTLTMPVEHSMAYDTGRIFAVSQDGSVLALDAASGDILWQKSLGNPVSRWIYSAPIVKDNILYCGNSAFFAALDTNTGNIKWSNIDGYDWISSFASPAIADKNVLMGSVWLKFGNKFGSLYAMDAETGKRQWALNSVGFHASASFSNDKIYCTDTRGIMYEIAPDNGSVLWKKELEPGWSTTTPVSNGDVLISGSGQGTFYCHQLREKTQNWEFKTPVSVFNMSPYYIDHEPLLSSPVISGDLVYVGSGSGWVYAFDLKTGKIQWHYNFGVPVLSTPVISGNCLFLCTSTGNIFCLTSLKSQS